MSNLPDLGNDDSDWRADGCHVFRQLLTEKEIRVLEDYANRNTNSRICVRTFNRFTTSREPVN